MFVLPINRDNEVDRPPFVVFGLMLANTAILLATWLVHTPTTTLFRLYGFTPAHPTFTTALSSMFLHAGCWHLAGNLWFLWMFGNRVEQELGSVGFAGAYVLFGLAGTATHWMLNTSSSIPCVGASGAISGVAGAFFVLFPRCRFDLVFYILRFEVKTVQTFTHAAVGTWVGEQVLLGLLSQNFHVFSTAFWAHVGGFAGGVIVAGVYTIFRQGGSADRQELQKSASAAAGNG